MIWLRLYVLLGSALAFSLEPLASRLLLPHFGGAFYVWATSMTFFQGALVVGYVYADRVAARLGRLHLLLLLLPLGSLPFVVHAGGETPLSLFAALSQLAAVPFLLLSGTSVLAQRWLSASALPERGNPYPLYVASNWGSLGALLAYALVVEPLFGLRVQGWLWFGLYVLYLVAAIVAYRASSPRPSAEPVRVPAPARTYALWMLLAAGPAALSLAVTNLLIVEIGNTPCLWVAPLALYLASFILAFGRIGTPPALVRLFPHFALGSLALYTLTHGAASSEFLAVLCLALVFAISWRAHGALYASRPNPSSLGAYYSALALGGWLGGASVAFLAPALFSELYEFPVAVLFTAGAVLIPDPRHAFERAGRWTLAGVALAAGALSCHRKLVAERGEYVILQQRSPYGVYRVIDSAPPGAPRRRRLDSGRTQHGVQVLRADGSFDPAPRSYYHAAGPLGAALQSLPAPRHIGVIGLGVGAIAGLLEAGDSAVFYEIDPTVVEIARRDFGYLSLPPHIDVRTGDARRLLASEAERGAPRYQLLIVDAFTGDGVPVHLLTTEALQLYLGRVEAGGSVILHVSNRFLPLERVVAADARALGTPAALRQHGSGLAPGERASAYTAIGNVAALGWAPLDAAAREPWTDDRSSPFALWLGALW